MADTATHLTLGSGKAVHVAFQHEGQPPTSRPLCGAGSRRAKGTVTTTPVTCAKCAAR